MSVEIKGCGCRIRTYPNTNNQLKLYEYLCPEHKDEFILKLYNYENIYQRKI